MRVTERGRIFILMMAAGCLAGCQSSSNPPADSGGVHSLPVAGGNDSEVSVDQAVLTEASAVRLDDILEAVLLYFNANKGMPAQLEDLRTVAGDADLNLMAPSGQPYAYIAQGLSAPRTNKLLIVYDPVESSNGKRWCILVSQLQSGSPLTAEVMSIPEIMFREYLVSNHQ